MPVDLVENRTLAVAPFRCNEDGTRRITGYAVHGDVRWDVFDAIDQDVDIVIHGIEWNIARIGSLHAGSFYNVQHMKLDTKYVLRGT